MTLGEAWRRLKLARTEDTTAIRRAYAAQLRALDLDRDAQDYADLRTAREIALRWAASRRSAPAEAAEGMEVAAAEAADRGAPAAWPYAAPLLDGGDPDPALAVALPEQRDRPYRALGSEIARQGEVREIRLPSGDPFAVPPLTSPPDAAAALIQPDRGRDTAFYNALFPGGEPSEEVLEGAALTLAQGHFRSILRRAQEGDLALAEATDNWLADTLARAWPRSAPFVEAAAEAFGWREQAGLLGERDAVAFLNPRLKGMRFHERVLEPDHVLHKAWAELCRPGPASRLHRLQVGRGDIEQLILGVRKNFPELEHFWDPERVLSWEKGASTSSGGPGAWVWALIILGGLRLLASLPGSEDRDAVAAPPAASAYLDATQPAANMLLEDTIESIFGDKMDAGALDTWNAELGQTFRANLPRTLQQVSDLTPPGEAISPSEAYRIKMRNLVRDRVYRAAVEAGDPELGEAMQLRLAYLVAARRLGADACMSLYRLAEVPAGVSLEASVVAREQALAARYLRAGLLTNPGPRQAARAQVSGALVETVVRETGLPLPKIAEAMQGKGSDENRCAVTIALLRATLKSSGPNREAILRTL